MVGSCRSGRAVQAALAGASHQPAAPPSPAAGHSPSGKLVVAPGKLAPVSRLGGNTYGRTAGMYDLPRPDRDPKTAAALNYTSTAT